MVFAKGNTSPTLVSIKNIPYGFIEGQTHFDMPRGVKMTLAFTEPKYFKFKNYFQVCTTSGNKYIIDIVCRTKK